MSLLAALSDPFATAFFVRALVGGVLAAAICAVVGAWVVARGMAFLGEALAHGMLPGVALATLLGGPALLGAAVAAAAMSVGVSALSRRGRLGHDTAIGMLFVAMLALGVIIVSASRSFATDLTAILFGDILAIRTAEVVLLAIGLGIAILLVAVFHRAFLALAVDVRVAAALGLRPRLAQAVLIGLVTLAVVACYQAVGTLLVVGLLLAPAVAARPWVRRMPGVMLLGALVGALAVVVGLLVSWHAGTAAGATVALVAVLLAGASFLVRRLIPRPA